MDSAIHEQADTSLTEDEAYQLARYILWQQDRDHGWKRGFHQEDVDNVATIILEFVQRTSKTRAT